MREGSSKGGQASEQVRALEQVKGTGAPWYLDSQVPPSLPVPLKSFPVSLLRNLGSTAMPWVWVSPRTSRVAFPAPELMLYTSRTNTLLLPKQMPACYFWSLFRRASCLSMPATLQPGSEQPPADHWQGHWAHLRCLLAPHHRGWLE